MAVGDFSGDSDPDLAVANALSNDVSVLLGGPGGSFSGPTNFPAGTSPWSVGVGDFNADSHAHLAVANNLSNNVSVLLNRTARPATTCSAETPETTSSAASPART